MEIIKDYERAYEGLGQSYLKSTKLISARITELQEQLEKQKNGTKENKSQVEELKDRINKLKGIHRTTREIGIEARNYYKRGWWRSEKYTTNSRKSRLPVFYYGYVIKDEDEYEPETDREDEAGFDDCYGISID